MVAVGGCDLSAVPATLCDGQFRYYRRRRVEGSWPPLNFPEAWIACVCNVVLNSRGQRKRNEPAC